MSQITLPRSPARPDDPPPRHYARAVAMTAEELHELRCHLRTLREVLEGLVGRNLRLFGRDLADQIRQLHETAALITVTCTICRWQQVPTPAPVDDPTGTIPTRATCPGCAGGDPR